MHRACAAVLTSSTPTGPADQREIDRRPHRRPAPAPGRHALRLSRTLPRPGTVRAARRVSGARPRGGRGPGSAACAARGAGRGSFLPSAPTAGRRSPGSGRARGSSGWPNGGTPAAGPGPPVPTTSRSSGSLAQSTRTGPAGPRTTSASMLRSAGRPPSPRSKASQSRSWAASRQSLRSWRLGWRRSARSPPGGTQAMTGTSRASRFRASFAAKRSACRLPREPCTPAKTRRTPDTAHRLLPSYRT